MSPQAKGILLDSGQVAVVLAAAAVLLLIEGAGFICPMVAVLLVGVVLLRGIASGFGGKVRQRVISLISVAAFAGLLVGMAAYRSMPENLFRKYVADPIPASVRIIHSEYQGGRDPAVYLHFKVSPEDLERLLRAREYVQSDSLRGPSGHQPEWWSPLELSDPQLYVWRPEGQEREDAAWLWVNEGGTEAYFTHWNF